MAASAKSKKKSAESEVEATPAPVAVVRTGGKQYVVSAGQKLLVEKLDGKAGDTITLSEVLLISNDSETKVGTPTVAGSNVKATIVAQRKMKKVIHFKKQRRTGYLRKRGHRQEKTEIRIESF